MSAAPRIIEGTWDEVLSHAHELTGHRLRVVVMDESAAPTYLTSDSTLSQRQAWVADLYAWALNRPPLGPWDDSRDTIYGDIPK